MCFLLRSDKKIGLSIFLCPRVPRRVHLCHILLPLKISVLPLQRFSGTCLFRSCPVLSVRHSCPSYVSSTHGVVLFFCLVLPVRFRSEEHTSELQSPYD